MFVISLLTSLQELCSHIPSLSRQFKRAIDEAIGVAWFPREIFRRDWRELTMSSITPFSAPDDKSSSDSEISYWKSRCSLLNEL
mmetsp:Transcript_21596/g.21354  ORF Transcript_21596/g.21354 Transcript_21596/m.21354 type:complete len:84 (+) Transcript_21596:327-578(+)